MATSLTILDDDGVYLDIDSNNNDGYGLSETTSEWQAKASSDTGKIVTVDDGDPDAHGIPGWADGYNLPNSPAVGLPAPALDHFYQMILQVPPGIDPTKAKFKFTYSGSDPMAVTYDPATGFTLPSGGGALRVWAANANSIRSGSDLKAGGSYITPGVEYSSLNLSHVIGGVYGILLYVEAVKPSSAAGDLSIKVEMDPDGSGNWVSDTVKLTAITVHLVPEYINQDDPTNTSYARLQPGSDGTYVVYGGSEASTSDKLRLTPDIEPRIFPASSWATVNWSVGGPGSSAYIPLTGSPNSIWDLGSIHAKSGILRFSGSWTFDAQHFNATLPVEVGIRTDDTIVVGWINPNGVPLNPVGVDPRILAIFNPGGPSLMAPSDFAVALAALASTITPKLTGLRYGDMVILNPATPLANPSVTTLPLDRTYLLDWLFKYAANTDPMVTMALSGNFRNNTNNMIDYGAVAAFQSTQTNYKLFNHFQIKYRVGTNGFAGKPIVLHDEEGVGTTVDPLSGLLFPGQDGPAATGKTPFINSNRASSIVDGSPDSKGVVVTNAIANGGFGAATNGWWENIGDRITFHFDGMNGDLTKPDVIVQNYPTYYVFLNGVLQTTQAMTFPQASSPFAHFYVNPYPWGPETLGWSFLAAITSGSEPTQSSTAGRHPNYSVP